MTLEFSMVVIVPSFELSIVVTVTNLRIQHGYYSNQSMNSEWLF